MLGFATIVKRSYSVIENATLTVTLNVSCFSARCSSRFVSSCSSAFEIELQLTGQKWTTLAWLLADRKSTALASLHYIVHLSVLHLHY